MRSSRNTPTQAILAFTVASGMLFFLLHSNSNKGSDNNFPTYHHNFKEDIKSKPKPHSTLTNYATSYNEASYPFMDFKKSRKLKEARFWKSHRATYTCPKSLLARVGSETEDGGKWLCGLDTLGRRNLVDGYNCTFYSFGVAGDSSFEAEVLRTTHCSVYAYDPQVDNIGPPLKPTNPRVHFFKMGISGKDGSVKNVETKTLKTLMTENGHHFIDILKVDVEGWEFDALDRMLNDFEQLPFGQLLLEIHNHVWKAKGVKKVTDLVRNLEKRGARVFSVEPNEKAIKCCSEFSFINLNYLSLFIPRGISK